MIPRHIEVLPDDTVWDIVNDAWRIACALERDVSFVWKGHKVILGPKVDPEELVERLKQLEPNAGGG